MGDLYLIFFGSGLLVFAAIVAYSVLQKRRSQSVEKLDYTDPLFEELEHSNANTDASLSTSSNDDNESDKESGVSSTNEKKAPKIDSDISDTSEDKTESAVGKKAPSLDDISEGASKETLNLDESNEPALTEDSVGSQSATVHHVNAAPKPQFDETSSSIVTELVARIKNDDAIEQQGLLSLFRKHDFKFQRKVHIFGLNQLTDMWRDIEFELPSARFTELGVSIQLADREGAMSQKELHDFQQMVLEFTDFYDAPFEFSMEIDDALKQALALDQIGRRYDSMAVLNVVPKSKTGFRMADIESCARDLMMSADKNGIFMKTVGTKNNISILFRLACTDDSGQFGIPSSASTPIHDLVVYMNVPATSDPETVFQEMVRDTNSLATWLEGKVVDRNGRVMSQRSYSVLMQQVSDIAFSMQQDGFTPGDAVAKKLF